MKLATTHPHAFGMLVTALGLLVFVPDALLLRLIGGDMLAVSVWRGLSAGSVFLIWSYGISNASRPTLRDSLSGLCLLVAVLEGASMILFCASIGHTSVSNALFIFATAPLIAAVLSWVFLRETVPVQTLMAIIVSLIGVTAIVSGSFGGASLLGDGLAFLNGAIILPVAIGLLSIGPRYLPAAEVSMFTVLEVILAPLLVWFVLGENPGSKSLIGGAIIVSAIFLHALWRLRKEQI